MTENPESKKYYCKFCKGELAIRINRHKKAHADT